MSTNMYRSEKEALAYRLKEVLPIVLEYNNRLYNSQYRLAKPTSLSNFNYRMDTFSFVEESEQLHSLTTSFLSRIDKVKDYFIYANWEDLVIIDRECNSLIKELNLEINIPPYKEMLETINGKTSTDNVDYFKTSLQVEAINMLNVNRGQVENTIKEYSIFEDNPDSSGANKLWDKFQLIMDMDRELDSKVIDVIEEIERLVKSLDGVIAIEDRMNDFVRETEDRIERGHDVIDQINNERENLYSIFNVARMVKSNKSDNKNKGEIYKIIRGNCNRALKEMDKFESKILNGKVDLYKLLYLVTKVKEMQGISDINDDLYSIEVLNWLNEVEFLNKLEDMLCTGVSVGAALICLIPGIGLTATLALGAAGSTAGLISAISNFDEAIDLYNAARLGSYGTEKFADKDEADIRLINATFDLCFSLIDGFLAVKQIPKACILSNYNKNITKLHKLVPDPVTSGSILEWSSKIT